MAKVKKNTKLMIWNTLYIFWWVDW